MTIRWCFILLLLYSDLPLVKIQAAVLRAFWTEFRNLNRSALT
jgi:hypothetical protein